MYILKNSLISIARNKGRNILIGIIILVIACASTVTLAIRNTANNLVKDYEESHDITGTISFDRGQLSNNFKGGEDAQKSNIEAFNNIESITLDDVKNYGDSEYLKGYYYLYATSLNSDTLTKATDSFEYEVEDRETTTTSTSTTTGGNGNGIGRGPGGGEDRHTITNNNTTTIITKSKEKFESSYPKGVRIAAIIGVIFLVALYIVTLIAGITTSKAAPELFKMCIGSSILLPILFWLYIQFAKSFMNRDRENIKKEK